MFAQACERLIAAVGIPNNFKSQNIPEDKWMAKVHRIAMNAYEDQCSPANPRMPMVKDMEKILIDTYYGPNGK